MLEELRWSNEIIEFEIFLGMGSVKSPSTSQRDSMGLRSGIWWLIFRNLSLMNLGIVILKYMDMGTSFNMVV